MTRASRTQGLIFHGKYLVYSTVTVMELFLVLLMEPSALPDGQVTATESASMVSAQTQPLTLRERRQARLEQYRKSQQKNFFSVRSLQKTITTLWSPLPVEARPKPVLITDTVAILPPPVTVAKPAPPKASASDVPPPLPKKDRWPLKG